MIQLGAQQLTYLDLITHLHCTGRSRSGKSKLLELIARQLITQGKPFLLIDPNGSLYRDIVEWLAYMRPSNPPILMDLSYGNRIPGYNPFRIKQEGKDYLMTKTDRMVAATTMASGATEQEGPRLTKLLRCIYYALIQQKLPISAADHFLNWHSKERKAIVDNIDSEPIRITLLKLYSGSQQTFETYIDSVASRLQLFIHPHVRRIMAVPDNCIDVEDIVDSGKSLLLNLQPSNRQIVSPLEESLELCSSMNSGKFSGERKNRKSSIS